MKLGHLCFVSLTLAQKISTNWDTRNFYTIESLSPRLRRSIHIGTHLTTLFHPEFENCRSFFATDLRPPVFLAALCSSSASASNLRLLSCFRCQVSRFRRARSSACLSAAASCSFRSRSANCCSYLHHWSSPRPSFFY